MAKEKSKVIRVSTDIYNKLMVYKKNKTFNTLIGQVTELLDSDIQYLSHRKLFDNIADARGHAIEVAIKTQSEIERPLKIMNLGPDSF